MNLSPQLRLTAVTLTTALAATHYAAPGARAQYVGEALVAPERAREAAAGEIEIEPRDGLNSTLRSVPALRVRQVGGAGMGSDFAVRGTAPEQNPVFFGDLPIDPLYSGATDLALLGERLPLRARLSFGASAPLASTLPIGGSLTLLPEFGVGPLAVSTRAGAFGQRGLNLVAGKATERMRMVVAFDGLTSDNDYPFIDDGGSPLAGVTPQRTRRANAQVRRGTSLLGLDGITDGGTQLGGALLLSGLERGVPGPGFAQSQRADTGNALGAAIFRARGTARDIQWQSSFGLLVNEARFNDSDAEVTPIPTETRTLGVRLLSAFSAEVPVGETVAVAPGMALTHDDVRRREAAFPEETIAGGSQRLTESQLNASVAVPWRPAVAAGVLEVRPEVRTLVTLGSDVDAPPLPTVRLGAAWQYGALLLFSSAGLAARAPSLLERFGDGGLTTPSPDLRPERALISELGVELRKQLASWHVRGRAAAFAGLQWQLIRFVRTAQFQATALNIEEGHRIGVDASVDASFSRYLRLEGAVAALRSVDDRGFQLPGTPPVRVDVHAEAGWLSGQERNSLASPKTFTGSVFAHSEYVHSAFADRSGLVALPSRAPVALGFRLGYGPTTSLILRVDDLGDVGGQDLLGFPLPGRRWEACLTIRALP